MSCALERALCDIGNTVFRFLSLRDFYALLVTSKQIFYQTYPHVAILSYKKTKRIFPGSIKYHDRFVLSFVSAFDALHKPNLILSAAWGGHAGLLQKAIEHSGTKGLLPEDLLLAGVAGGDLDVVRFVLSKGLDIHKADRKGYQPLHLAAIYKHSSIIAELVKAGANLDRKLSDMRRAHTPMHLALHPTSVLLSPQKRDRNYQPFDISQIIIELTLHPQSTEEKLKVYATVHELLSLGADPHIPDIHNQTPLDYASFYGPLSVVQLLLEKHPSTLSPSSKKTPGYTPLELAVIMGQKEIVEELLKHLPSPKLGDTPFSLLGYAVSYNRVEIAHMLIEANHVINEQSVIFLPLKSSWTEQQILHTMKLLVSKGANVNSRDNSATALHLAVQLQYLDVVRLLLDHGADVTKKDMLQRSCLDWAIGPWATLNPELVKLILTRDVSSIINQLDVDGNTPLMRALEAKNRKIVLALLEKGASVTIRNKKGKLPHQLGFDGDTQESLQLAYIMQQSNN